MKSFLSILSFFLLTGFSVHAQIPVINSFSPSTALVGSTVTISGSGFDGTSPSKNQVFFGSSQATVTSASFGTLTVLVPAGSTTNLISVRNATTNLIGYSRNHFNGLFCATPLTSSTYSSYNQELGGIYGAYNIDIYDIDGDGKSDIVTGNNNSGITIAHNQSVIGTMNFAPYNINTGANVQQFFVADFDGDGKRDIVISGGNGCFLFPNLSTPGNVLFGSRITIDVSRQYYQCAAGDLNNDGKVDFVAGANDGQYNLYSFRNTSTGPGNFSFAANTVISSPGCVSRGMQCVDLDGDGISDIVGTTFDCETVYAVRNTTSAASTTFGFASTQSFACPGNPYRLKLGDFDKDGKIDLVTPLYTSSQTGIFRNISTIGNINFSPLITLPAVINNYRVGVGDVNGDGFPDIVTKPNGVGTLFQVYKNISTGTGSISFAPPITYYSTAGAEVGGIAIGDMDGDLVPDIATSGISSSVIRFHRNVSAQPDVTPPTAACKSITVALSPSGTVAVTGSMIDNGSADGCGLASLKINGQASINFSCADVGAHTVILTATDLAGNTSNCTSIVTVSPAAIIVAGQATVCQGQTVLLTANLGDSYQWHKDGANMVGATNQTLTATVSGNYTVSVTNAGGCSGTSSAVTVTVNNNPTVSTTPSGNAFLCSPNNNTVISASLSSVYQWKLNGVDIPSATQQFYTATTAGNYTAQVIDVFGCTATSAPIMVSANPPKINIKGNGVSIADGDLTPSTSDNTDFGVSYPSNPLSKIFTIENTGTGLLNLSSINVSGANAANFTISGITLPVSVLPNATATFTVTFNGVALNIYNAIITVNSNDCNLGVYNYSIKANISCVPPAIVSLANLVVNSALGSCDAIVSYNSIVSGLPTPTVGYVFSGATTGSGSGTGTGANFHNGVTTVTLTATSNCGTVVSEFTITVADKQAPTISSPANQSLDLDANCSTVLPDYRNMLTVSDNCTPTSALTVTQSPAPGTVVTTMGITTVTFTVTDASGNTSTSSISVNRNDVTPPTIACHSPIAVSSDKGVCGAVVTFPLPSVTDNCSMAGVNVVKNGSFETGNYSGWTIYSNSPSCGIFGIGTAGQTLNNGDAFFNYANNTTQSVTYPQGLPITFVPTDGQKMMAFFQNCGGTTHYLYQDVLLSSGSTQLCYDLQYRNFAGSFSSNQFVAVEIRNPITNAILQTLSKTIAGDPLSIPMTHFCFDLSAYVGQNVRLQMVNANISENPLDVFIDNVTLGGSTTLIQTGGLPSGSLFPVGSTTNTFKATDASGNSSTCSFTVTVADDESPILTVPAAITVNCGASLLPTNTGNATATDNCNTNIVIAYSDNTVAPSNCGGTIIRTWTATDAANNKSVATQTITVSPATLPTMTAPAAITVACGGLPTPSTISFSNGLSGGCLISGTSSKSTFSVTPAACGGFVTETWTATDLCGRTIASVSRIITVSPATLPTMTAPAAVTVACGGLPTASTISFSNGLSGGCLISGTSNASTFTATPAACGGEVTETWTATDLCGRTIASVSRIITVSPAALPTMTAPAAVTVAFGGLPTASTIKFSNGLSGGCLINGTSNTSTFSKSPASCGGTVTETWTATDLCGRTIASVSRIITVSPATLPTMTAPAAVTISLACGATPVRSTIPFSNGLSGSYLISGTSNPSTFVTTPGTCGGTVTESWTATDICGRTIASVSRTLTVSQNLGTVQNFILFSGVGAVSNTGTSTITGDIGANVGAISGFAAPSTVTGSIYSPASANATQAKIDLLNLYLHLSNIPVTNSSHAAAFGSGETVAKGVYYIPSAGSMAGNLILDGQGDSNSVSIIKFDGAFSPAAGSTITLANGMRACNVYIIANGAISIGASSVMKGTFIGHTGAVTMGAGGNLEGRLLSTVGAVTFGPGTAMLPSGLTTIPIVCVDVCNNSIMGSLSNFALFTSAGAVSNTGSSGVIGNIGSNAGAITGLETPATTLVGTSFNADAVTAQAKTDLQAAYVQLAGIAATNTTHGVAFGSGETLTPGVYTVGAAGSLAGTLTLDAQGNPDAIFIFRFGGAFVTAAQSKVVLINGAGHCNIFWIAEGAVSMGTFSVMKGTLIANNGANTMGSFGNLEGSMFSTAGAIGFNSGVAFISYSLCGNPVPVATTATSTASITAASALSAGLMALHEERLSIYPNPNNGVLHLDYSGDVSKVLSIDVSDGLGKRVFSINHFQSVISLDSKATGVYFVRVHFNSKTITYKIIVNK